MVRQAEALYDTLMKVKSGPAQSSKPAAANWASAGWKRGADSGNAGVFVAVQCCVYVVRVFCSAHCTGNYQKWQRTGDGWKGKYAQGSYHKDTATFKGKCNKCGQYGHKSNECNIAAQTP